MKSTNKINWNRISKSFKQYLKEAEEAEEAPAEEEGGDNPFAAAPAEGGDEAPAADAAPADDTAPADDAEEKEGETAPAAEKPAATASAPAKPSVPKSITIKCKKGSTTKKVVGSKPVCPKGYKKV